MPLNKIEGGASISPTLTGLIAMDLVKNFNKPVLVLREIIEEDVVYYRGSGRSKEILMVLNRYWVLYVKVV